MKLPPGFSGLGDLFLNGCVFPEWELQTPLLLGFVVTSPYHILFRVLECVILGGGRDTYHPARRARALSSDMVAHASILAGTSLLTLWAMFARRTKILTAEGCK